VTLNSNIPPDTEVYFYFVDDNGENVLWATCEGNDAMDPSDYTHCIEKDNLVFPNSDPVDIGLYKYTLQSDNRTLVRTDHVEEPPEEE
jgi:hypothetical protein